MLVLSLYAFCADTENQIGINEVQNVTICIVLSPVCNLGIAFKSPADIKITKTPNIENAHMAKIQNSVAVPCMRSSSSASGSSLMVLCRLWFTNSDSNPIDIASVDALNVSSLNKSILNPTTLARINPSRKKGTSGNITWTINHALVDRALVNF